MNFDYNSRRAREARFGKICGNKLVVALEIILMVSGTAAGAALILSGYSAGWLGLVFAAPAAMLFYFNKHELRSVPVKAGSSDVNDLLSTRTLAALPKDPDVKALAAVSESTRSGRFLAMRFGITRQYLETLAAGPAAGATTEQVFLNAKQVMDELNAATISGGMIAVGIVMTLPDPDLELAQIKMSLADLKQGVVWYNYLHGLVKDAQTPRRTGGIARDLAFGYIPLLSQFGTNISASREGVLKTRIHLASSRDVLEKMTDIFSQHGRQNVALIGPYGSGRTTIVNAFADLLLDADSRIPNDLKFRQIFVLNAASLIGAAKNGSVESLVQRILAEAYAAKNIIVCLDDAHLFFKNGTGSVDISNVLLPILEAGNLRMILEMDDQKFLEISAEDPALANALNKIQVRPADEKQTMDVLMDQAPVVEYAHKTVITWNALKAAYRYSDRYIHDAEMPGKAKILLEQAANFPEGGLVTEHSVTTAVERMEGVKINAADTDEQRGKLLNLESEIHKRMIDQAGAVKTVSDALRRAAAGVRNEKRPVGTFLFLGPTGVGKTELAKALSEVYFGGENSLIRIDLNEYVQPGDVARLIEDGAKNEHSLTAQIRKQPFSVVLLDEIEKADPAVLTTLLQMLDEGILRDEQGREVSFRDAIVIATSNAGADRIRGFVQAGSDLPSRKEELLNGLIASGTFKPEFLNRFDEICLFKPLAPEELMQISDLILDGVNRTLAPKKISVELTPEAKQELIRNGFDPAMGARPMRRIIQKTVENIAAKKMLSGEAQPGARILIDAPEIRAELGE